MRQYTFHATCATRRIPTARCAPARRRIALATTDPREYGRAHPSILHPDLWRRRRRVDRAPLVRVELAAVRTHPAKVTAALGEQRRRSLPWLHTLPVARAIAHARLYAAVCPRPPHVAFAFALGPTPAMRPTVERASAQLAPIAVPTGVARAGCSRRIARAVAVAAVLAARDVAAARGAIFPIALASALDAPGGERMVTSGGGGGWKG